MQCACAILSICGLPRSTVFFHIISQTARSSKKTSYRKQKCVLISLHLLSETFLNQEEMNEIWLKNVYWFPCKVKVKVKPAKTGHGPHSSSFLCCSMYCLFCDVLCIVCVYMCTVLLSPGGYPIAVKYIISVLKDRAVQKECRKHLNILGLPDPWKSVSNNLTLCNIPEELGSDFYRGGSLKSC